MTHQANASPLRTYLGMWLRWLRGRQGTGYDKMLLLATPFPIRLDAYLLRYPQGCEIPPHTDPVAAGRHYRLNVVVWRAREGGEFVCAGALWQRGRVALFRPDCSEHAVTRVAAGRRYVLSIGWVLGREPAGRSAQT
jgi:2OG-Fe(II) oxygenase superfamily